MIHPLRTAPWRLLVLGGLVSPLLLAGLAVVSSGVPAHSGIANAVAEEATAASISLRQQAEELSREIRTFKFGGVPDRHMPEPQPKAMSADDLAPRPRQARAGSSAARPRLVEF